jgi:ATP-binding cassette subfamily F protein 3
MIGSTPTSELSGGWKMRVAMARVPRAPDILLMDEPTNHLDIESIICSRTKSLPGSLLMTSHDREFMNRIRPRSPRSTAARLTSTRQLRFLRARSHPQTNRVVRPPAGGCSPRAALIDRFAAHAAGAAQVREPREGAREREGVP